MYGADSLSGNLCVCHKERSQYNTALAMFNVWENSWMQSQTYGHILSVFAHVSLLVLIFEA